MPDKDYLIARQIYVAPRKLLSVSGCAGIVRSHIEDVEETPLSLIHKEGMLHRGLGCQDLDAAK